MVFLHKEPFINLTSTLLKSIQDLNMSTWQLTTVNNRIKYLPKLEVKYLGGKCSTHNTLKSCEWLEVVCY